jgi:hypothetical protein
MKPDYRTLSPDTLLLRNEQPDYFQQVKHAKVTASRLAKLASAGRGPIYTKICGRVMSRISWLNDWFEREAKAHMRTAPRTPYRSARRTP